MTLSEEILALDKGIRFVALLDKTGKIREAKTREDVVGKEFMPIHRLEEIGSTMFRTVWSVGKSLTKYFGKNLRVVFHYEKIDFIVIELEGKIAVITTDKNVQTDDLARRILKLRNKE